MSEGIEKTTCPCAMAGQAEKGGLRRPTHTELETAMTEARERSQARYETVLEQIAELIKLQSSQLDTLSRLLLTEKMLK